MDNRAHLLKSRREMLRTSALGFGHLALMSLLAEDAAANFAAQEAQEGRPRRPRAAVQAPRGCPGAPKGRLEAPRARQRESQMEPQGSH